MLFPYAAAPGQQRVTYAVDGIPVSYEYFLSQAETATVGGRFGLLEMSARASRGRYLGSAYSYRDAAGTNHAINSNQVNTYLREGSQVTENRYWLVSEGSWSAALNLLPPASPQASQTPQGQQERTNPYRSSNADCSIEVRVNGSLSKGTPKFFGGPDNTTLGSSISTLPDGNRRFSQRFEVIGQISSGRIGTIGQQINSSDSPATNLNNGGAWMIGQVVWHRTVVNGRRFSSYSQPDETTHNDAPAQSVTFIGKNGYFAWRDEPAVDETSPGNRFTYATYSNFIVYAQNGGKRCEVRFHIISSYLGGTWTSEIRPGNF